MEFLVKLLKADKSQTDKAIKILEKECIYIDGEYWILEGEPSYLVEDGVKFKIVSEGYVPSLGGLSKNELIDLCKNSFGVNIS